MVLLSAVAAVVFMLLSFKILIQEPARKDELPSDEKPPVSFSESFINHKLTKREAEIAQLVFNGMTNAQIGKKLFITEGTVKKNLTSVFDKYKAKSRSELMSKAIYECVL